MITEMTITSLGVWWNPAEYPRKNRILSKPQRVELCRLTAIDIKYERYLFSTIPKNLQIKLLNIVNTQAPKAKVAKPLQQDNLFNNLEESFKPAIKIKGPDKKRLSALDNYIAGESI